MLEFLAELRTFMPSASSECHERLNTHHKQKHASLDGCLTILKRFLLVFTCSHRAAKGRNRERGRKSSREKRELCGLGQAKNSAAHTLTQTLRLLFNSG